MVFTLVKKFTELYCMESSQDSKRMTPPLPQDNKEWSRRPAKTLYHPIMAVCLESCSIWNVGGHRDVGIMGAYSLFFMRKFELDQILPHVYSSRLSLKEY